MFFAETRKRRKLYIAPTDQNEIGYSGNEGIRDVVVQTAGSVSFR